MLRLLEHYVSTQGEGPNVGKLTQFVRFAGCNLKCPGWPCDTPYAIEPELYRAEQQAYTPGALATKIHQVWSDTGARNVCFTGGEPLIQPQSDLVDLTNILNNINGLIDCEFFTNGTRDIWPSLARRATFVMDWKLPGSGEDYANKTRFENLKLIDRSIDSIKFVIAQAEDLTVAHTLYRRHLLNHKAEVYVGAAWKLYSTPNIVEYVKENYLPWRLNVQVHNYIYGEQKRGT